MDFHKIGNGYVVLERDGEIARAYLNNGIIIEQKSNTFKVVYDAAKRTLRYEARQQQTAITQNKPRRGAYYV